MEYVAAYTLLVLGGNTSPTFDQVKSLFLEINYEGDDYLIKLLIFALKGKNILQITTSSQTILQQFVLDQQKFIDQKNLIDSLFQQELIKEKEERMRLEQIAQIKRVEEERQKLIELEKQKREKEEIIRQQRIEKEKKKQEEERRRQQQILYLRQEELKILETQKKLTEQLKTQTPKEQLLRLEQEIQSISQNNTYSKTYQTYQITKCEQKQLKILKETSQVRQVTSISHISQEINAGNQDVLFYILTENLRRYQNRDLLLTQNSQTIGLTSVLFSQSQDYKCFRYHTTEYDFDEINNDQLKKAVFIEDLMQKISKTLKVPLSDIEILGITKGSLNADFIIKSENELDDKQLKALKEVCGGNIEVYWYFAGPQGSDNLVGLAYEDFSPQFNMQWENFHEKEQRGPKYHRYDYYFPKGYYGYALNVLNGRYGKNSDWIQMNGNDNEWRILYHGTKHASMCSIVKNGLAPSRVQNNWNNEQSFQDDDCIYEGRMEKVGRGVYFSDRIGQCAEFAPPTQVKDKYFALVFQSRVNPRAIKQSTAMKSQNYFLVNRSQDIRPYRILLKDVGRQAYLDWQQKYNV